jgi:hypothetical protein
MFEWPDRVSWCCAGFQDAVEHAGNRGFGIFVDTQAEPFMFVLQHRSLDPGAQLANTNTPLNLVTETGLQYCPWCGKNLMRRYRRNLAKLARPDLKIPLT